MPYGRRMKIKFFIVEPAAHEIEDILRRYIACRREACRISVQRPSHVRYGEAAVICKRPNDIIELDDIRVQQCSCVISLHYGKRAVRIIERLNIYLARRIILTYQRNNLREI